MAKLGIVSAYMDAIEGGYMCFTSSIYMLVPDISGRYITKWARAIGCWPKVSPINNYFEYNKSDTNTSAFNLNIPIVVSGCVRYMETPDLEDFNILMERFNPAIANGTPLYNDELMINNMNVYPYLVLDGSNELQWRKIGE